jgi:hypothetical protein
LSCFEWHACVGIQTPTNKFIMMVTWLWFCGRDQVKASHTLPIILIPVLCSVTEAWEWGTWFLRWIW